MGRLLRDGLRRAMARAAFGAVGGLFLLVGAILLSVAAWLALALALGALAATLILGLCFAGAGMICLALAMRRPRPPVAPPAAPRAAGLPPDLLAAFLAGLDTGKAMARRPRGR